MMDPAKLSLSAALRAMKAGDLTAAALLEACLERINAREPEVLAWVTMDREAARTNSHQFSPETLGGFRAMIKKRNKNNNKKTTTINLTSLNT